MTDDRPAAAPGPGEAPAPAAAPELMPNAVRRHAFARPDAVAVHAPDTILTFGELAARAEATAAGLAARDIGPGERAAFVGRPTAAAIALLVGIGRAGAAAVPIGTRLAAPEITVTLEETDPGLLVVGRQPASTADAAAGALIPLAAMSELAVKDGATLPPSEALSPWDAAVVVMTSGTTGRAKGAVLTHGAMAASAAAWTAALPPATGWLLCLDLGHVAGLGVAWRALTAGVPLFITDGFRPADVLECLSQPDGPSHISLVPVQLARLLDEAAGATVPLGVRAVLLGGAPIPPSLVERALANGWPVVPTYGLTEAASGVTALSTAEAAEAPATAGRPLPGVEVRIDAAGPDGIGEIQVRSPSLFSGYLRRPAEGATARTDDGFLRTGDLGRLDEAGRLVVVDRRDDLLISGGENVYPAEVEAVLLAHPAIADAAVVGRRDPEWGEVPVAAVVLRPDAGQPTDQELSAFCRERLAGFKVPRTFLRVAEVPRTPSGKLRRAEVWAQFRTPHRWDA
jgi:o-succinylbenzoate---CoA ligase